MFRELLDRAFLSGGTLDGVHALLVIVLGSMLAYIAEISGVST